MEKIKDTIKTDLQKQWWHACNAYLGILMMQWELDYHYGYWIAEEVGGLFDYAGEWTISMNDIIYCVEHDVDFNDYMAWQEYCVDAHEFGFDIPNLRSWMMGCPRTSQETFEKLRQLKQDLNEVVEEEKAKQREASK